MAEDRDRDVTRQVWDGKIPIAFNLAKDEITSDEPPVTYYVCLARKKKKVENNLNKVMSVL